MGHACVYIFVNEFLLRMQLPCNISYAEVSYPDNWRNVRSTNLTTLQMKESGLVSFDISGFALPRRSTILRFVAGIFMVLLLALGTCCSRQAANALPTFPPIVADAYHPKAGGNVATHAQSCQLCHSAPPKLNVYGEDVKGALQAAHTKTLTPAILHSLDTKDFGR